MHFDEWLAANLTRHDRLTEAVVTIVRSLLDDSNIDYLSVVGRTKTEKKIREKIKRKGYRNPTVQLTDITGVRIVLFIESDLQRVVEVIGSAFEVDQKNSSNRDTALGTNQVGYRSHHFVCDLGKNRLRLPEFKSYRGLKFEIQLRTVLQHAWAEMAHDRSYHFQSELPTEIQRKLNLYAGLLEIADKGFSEIAREIALYSEQVAEKYSHGNLEVPINSLSLTEFFNNWAATNGVNLDSVDAALRLAPKLFAELASELEQFGIHTIKQLSDLCPETYVAELKSAEYSTNLFGVARDWMLIRNADKLLNEIGVGWLLEERDLEFLEPMSTPENFAFIEARFHRDAEED